jgi:hypothetical protein
MRRPILFLVISCFLRIGMVFLHSLVIYGFYIFLFLHLWVFSWSFRGWIRGNEDFDSGCIEYF